MDDYRLLVDGYGEAVLETAWTLKHLLLVRRIRPADNMNLSMAQARYNDAHDAEHEFRVAIREAAFDLVREEESREEVLLPNNRRTA